MFGVVRIGDQQTITYLQSSMISDQKMARLFEHNTGMPFAMPRQEYYRMPLNQDWREFLKECCDLGAKETEWTNPFISMIFDVIGSWMADDPIEAGHKAGSAMQKYRRISGN